MKKKTECHFFKTGGHWKSEKPEKNKDSRPYPKNDKIEGAYAVGLLSDHWINDSGANRHYCG